MSDETCEYGNLVTCARCLREAGLPAMSAPGADPLAAIRQRFVSRSQVRRLIMLDAGSVHDDICAILKQWDTRQSALRALVAQWRELAERDDAGDFDDCADALERILSGPQP